MSDYQDIIKQGYLKVKSKKLGLWQKRWLILRRASSKGANRLERYPDEKTSMLSYEAKTTDLTHVYRVDRLPVENRNYVLVLWFDNGDSKHLAANSDMDVTDWYDVLSEHVGGGREGPAQAAGPAAHNTPRDMYHVYLLPNTNTEHSGEYLIQVTSESIILRDVLYPAKVYVSWKLNTLRRYGRDDSKFTFESGRSSETGEGLFIFTSVDCERIYQKVHTATQALVTVKNMARRQQEGSMKDGTILSVSRSLQRNNSSSSETYAEKANGNYPKPDRATTKSLPLSPSRGPLPVPRSLSGKEQDQTEVPDANANTEYLYSTPTQERAVNFLSPDSQYLSERPLPTPNFSTSYANGEADETEYVYEEKGLSTGFKAFLAGRKRDDTDDC